MMGWSSWFRLSKNRNNAGSFEEQKDGAKREFHTGFNEDEFLGINQRLIDEVKCFTLDTFKNFPLPEEEHDRSQDCCDDLLEAKPYSTNVRNDLSEWQQQHAVSVLSNVKELSQVRFKLCPRHMDERQFWRIYFSLVRSLVSEHELRAIKLAKFRSMAVKDDHTTVSTPNEVEMADIKQES